MSEPLPRLRLDLDFMPSPVEDRPGLLIRDSFRYSDTTLVIPPPLVHCLEYFDGERTALDLKAELVRLAGTVDIGQIHDHLVDTLSRAGFLEDETYFKLREECHREFGLSPIKPARLAGSEYPEDASEARQVFNEWMAGAMPAPKEAPIAIAAPHISLFGGYECYRDAYSALRREPDATYIILGTSHSGPPDRFGLTRKDFETPFGVARTNQALVNELASQPAAEMEDYCHSFEHTIEFQVVFLQHVLGPDVSIVPVLCGSFAKSILEGRKPENNEDVARFFDALGEIGARERNVRWILSIDLAHMGARYGDRFAAAAQQGEMLEVAARDQRRIESINASDPEGFWSQVQERNDDLKWCGSSPVYTFLKAMPGVRGALRRYQQWNIDPNSVVSFAAMSFNKP